MLHPQMEVLYSFSLLLFLPLSFGKLSSQTLHRRRRRLAVESTLCRSPRKRLDARGIQRARDALNMGARAVSY